MFKIATWNVNSVRSRLPVIVPWLARESHDVVCLQETKCLSENFPKSAFENLGYHVSCLGQKTYNGVAILSKLPPKEIIFGLQANTGIREIGHLAANVDVAADPGGSARYLEILLAPSGVPVRVASVYAPNGNPVGSDKYTQKLRWLDQLIARARRFVLSPELFFLTGDYNIIPTSSDAAHSEDWLDDALFTPDARARYFSILHTGYTDALSAFSLSCYTFWDYKGRSFERNNGIRIDHVLVNPAAADRLRNAGVDVQIRAEKKSSDHAPVWVEVEPRPSSQGPWLYHG